jgi:hypothetical protein
LAETAGVSNWTEAVAVMGMLGLAVVSVAVNETGSGTESVTVKVATPFASVAMVDPSVVLLPVPV